MAHYTVAVMGETGVGKTNFLTRLVDNKYSPKHFCTVGTRRYEYTLDTTIGPIQFTLVDCAGRDLFRDNYTASDVDGAIVMYDVTSRITLTKTARWYLRYIKPRPCVICGNKIDSTKKVVNYEPPNDVKAKLLGHCIISAKTGENCAQPLLILLRLLTRNDTVHIV